MSAQHLLIRNLTAETIELQHVEIVEERGAGLAKSSRAWYSPFGSRTASPSPSSTDLAQLANSTRKHNVNVVIKPFALGRLPQDEASTASLSGTARRLTFSSAGHRYRLLLSPEDSHSQSLIPLTFEKPARNLSSIFLPTDNCLAIIDSSVQSHAHSWMATVPDSTPLSLLSLPGTHNSAACYKALPSVRCQVLSVAAQLDAGIRFFDLRVQIANPSNPGSDVLVLVHSIWSVAMAGTKYFRPVLDAIEEFLRRNPSETVVLSLKREGTGSGTDEQLSHLLDKHFASPSGTMWHTAPTIPELGAVRGKIVLLRRFNLHSSLQTAHEGKGWGLDAHAWQHNTECDYHGHVCAQDRFDMPEIKYWERKVDAVVKQLERSHDQIHHHHHQHGNPANDAQGQERPTAVLHLNFASASNFFRSSCWPDRIAARLNPAVLRYLCLFHGVVHDEETTTTPSSADALAANARRHRTSSIVEQPGFAEHLLRDDGMLAVDAVVSSEGAAAVGQRNGHVDALATTADAAGSERGLGGVASGSTGVVVLDWVGADGNWDLVNCIIAMNGRLKGE